MSFDANTIAETVATHGSAARVVIAAVKGSSPREVGASMLVWPGGQSGTIGGGALEYAAAKAAQATDKAHTNTHATTHGNAPKTAQVSHHALGPELGQCCGGHVTLVTEVFTRANLPTPGAPFVRRVSGTAPQPLKLTRAVATARQGNPTGLILTDGWLFEPASIPTRPLWIWGAGHVGRAMVQTLSPLPAFDITWIDTAPDRFPAAIPPNVTPLSAANPAAAVPRAPTNASHLILTYSHALDLELCHQLLTHGFAFAGLIGSQTKWARFKNRLRDLGHSAAQISLITCPIGDPALGKHPQAIAVGVAASLLSRGQQIDSIKDKTG